MNEIRAYRLLLNLSQKEFAKEIGINVRILQRVEQEKRSDPLLLYYVRNRYQIFSREVVEMKMTDPGKGRVKKLLS